MRSSLSQSQQGVSLIEVLVSLVIFSVGILGMTAMQSHIILMNKDQHQRDTALWTAQALIEQINVNKDSTALAQYVTSVSSTTLCDAAPATTCSETQSGGTETAAAVCSTTEMAAYDSWYSLCSSDESADEVLSGFSSTLSCDNTPCQAGDNMTLLFQWNSNIANSDPRLSGNTTITRNDGTVVAVNAGLEQYRQVFRP